MQKKKTNEVKKILPGNRFGAKTANRISSKVHRNKNKTKNGIKKVKRSGQTKNRRCYNKIKKKSR